MASESLYGHVSLNKSLVEELSENAKYLCQKGKGILAADESTGTIKKRFDNINVENTEANRTAYRSLLFSTKGLGEYISGAILFEETLYQKNPDGTPIIDLLTKEDIKIGIKVDKGLVGLALTEGEQCTQGLDGLSSRCHEYYVQGARFAKWRAVLTIDPKKSLPSDICIKETAHTLGKYAAICQANRLVPIVEPEILTDGAHDIDVCADVSERVWRACVKSLQENHVLLEGCLLKLSMITPGASCTTKRTPEDVSFFTIRTLRRCIPPAIPGIMFLSGGQSEEDASVNLNAINKVGPHPWSLSFSYGRALQASVLKTWGGKTESIDAAKKVLLERAKANSEAQLGKYSGNPADAAAATSLFEKKYIY